MFDKDSALETVVTLLVGTAIVFAYDMYATHKRNRRLDNEFEADILANTDPIK